MLEVSLIDGSGETMTAQDTADTFAEFFESVFTREPDGPLPPMPDDSYSQVSKNVIEFTPNNVKEAIASLKKDSSPGADGVPAVFLQSCVDVLCGPLSLAMKKSVQENNIPDMWKVAHVVPIFKKGNKSQVVNYRPISLNSNVGKCMEKVIVRQLTRFFVDTGVMPQVQHGFLPRRSVETNLLECVNNWMAENDRGHPIDILYLDFEKAFDKVPHRRLLLKLKHFGIRGRLLGWIEYYLKDRRFRVKVNGAYSGERRIISGVIQGSVIGPLLFLVYISDLPRDIVTGISLFADDTKLYCNPIENAVEFNQDIERVVGWTQRWFMALNVSKCVILHLGTNNPMLNYSMNGEPIREVTTQKDLGVVISSDLKWESHISGIVKRANFVLYLIRIAFKDNSAPTLSKLYKSHVRPILEYGESVWNPYYVKDIELLERVQRGATKIPPELSHLPYHERLKRMNLTTLAERRMRGDLIQSFKILNNLYDVDLPIFHLANDRQLRGHNKKLQKERCSKLPRRNFLTNRVVYRWNSLSADTVLSGNINQFKNRLDRELTLLKEQFVHYPS